VKVEYGIPTDKEALPLALGIERGFFRDEGLDLALKVVFGGPEIAAAYDSGALPIGELGSPPALTAIARGARFRIVGSGIRRRALQYFVAAPRIDGWAALRGRRVGALSRGSCSYWFGRLVLAANGLDPDRDVELVGLNERYPKVVDLFESGELAAAVLSEPNVSIGEDRGAFATWQALTDPQFCPAMQWTVVVAGERTRANEPDLIRAVLRASRRSYHWCNDHPDEWAAFIARRLGIPEATAARSIRRERPDLHYDCRPDLAGLELAIDLQLRLGAFEERLAVADITDLPFLPEEAPCATS
jgi:ABC-type nitrate/sulfonate/bicarbonate transport system substrate-binding protein